jgi:hypothetical protein
MLRKRKAKGVRFNKGLPGPMAAASDHDRHRLLICAKEEFSIVHSVAFGTEIAGRGSKTPTLRFLRF